MTFGVGVGAVADSYRQRNIFPLPEIGAGEGAEPSDFSWVEYANQSVRALNELAGCVNSDSHKKKKPTRVQRRVLQHIRKSFQSVFSDPDPVCKEGSLAGLCVSSKTYDSGRSDVLPYVKENISWPEACSKPVPLGDCLATADREWLGAWRTHMLRGADAAKVEGKAITPYIDPILKHDAKKYGEFLRELQSRNMIKFQHGEGVASKLGIFFVRKKSGMLRLIFDT